MSENIREAIRVCMDVHSDDSRGAVLADNKWNPGQTLRVRFLDGDAIVQQKIETVAHQWSQYINIQFEFGDDPDAEIRISCGQLDDQSWSTLGTDALRKAQDQPTMHYGWLTPDSSDEDYSSVVLHEFGHALGCIHEHQHPKAGIPWNRDAVYRYYMGPPNNWSKEKIDSNLFAQYSQDVTQFSQFDQQSIMLYPISKKLTTNGFEVGWNKYLSETDKAFMRAIYPRAEGITTLDSGQSLQPGQSLRSPNQLHELIMQADGNVVLYNDQSQPLWATNTYGISPREFIMQADGNLVLYDTDDRPKWASNTSNQPGAFLNVQDDGNLVVYRVGSQTETAENALWASGSNDM
jgi:serralysin